MNGERGETRLPEFRPRDNSAFGEDVSGPLSYARSEGFFHIRRALRKAESGAGILLTTHSP